MENIQYEFLTTIYDKEELRITAMLLSEANVRFTINDKSNSISGRAPLSTYIEADLLIDKSDFSRAAEFLKNIKK